MCYALPVIYQQKAKDKSGKLVLKSPYWYVKLRSCGIVVVHRSTGKTSKKEAETVEATEKIRLAREGREAGIRKSRSSRLWPFLKDDFLPWVEQRFKQTPNTVAYYRRGALYLSKPLGSLELSAISDREARQFERIMPSQVKNGRCEVSTINCGLKTLRRALNYAEETGRLYRAPKIRLAAGENARERILNNAECVAYVDACREPWKTAVTIILGTGARPGEVRSLRWENIEFEPEPIIRIKSGKTSAARRPLPMLPAARESLIRLHAEQGNPQTGWVFPARYNPSGHWKQGTQNKWHKQAIKRSGLPSFPPYCLRHTALTRFASQMDGFTLAAVAGHTTLQMTRRYVHPQESRIISAFKEMVRAENAGQSNRSEQHRDSG